MWTVILLDEVEEWFLSLVKDDPGTAEQVAQAIDLLAQEGPTLGRPIVDRIKSSRVQNMKELRPGSSGATEVRALFVFDPARQAVILVAGDKAGRWSDWYQVNIPIAERRYQAWLSGYYDEER